MSGTHLNGFLSKYYASNMHNMLTPMTNLLVWEKPGCGVDVDGGPENGFFVIEGSDMAGTHLNGFIVKNKA